MIRGGGGRVHGGREEEVRRTGLGTLRGRELKSPQVTDDLFRVREIDWISFVFSLKRLEPSLGKLPNVTRILFLVWGQEPGPPGRVEDGRDPRMRMRARRSLGGGPKGKEDPNGWSLGEEGGGNGGRRELRSSANVPCERDLDVTSTEKGRAKVLA